MSAADEVEVLLADRSWVAGYEVCGLVDTEGERAFQVRRQSDGSVLPDALPPTRIRPAHSAPALEVLRLYHECARREPRRFDARQEEEECITSDGWRVGVWLSTEVPARGAFYEADVDLARIEEFEISDDPGHRVFIVPAAVAAELHFRDG